MGLILTIDVGNSNIVLGGWNGNTLSFVSRLKTDRERMRDDYAVTLKGVLDLCRVHLTEVEGSIMSSVVPQVTGALVEAVEKLIGKRPLVLGPGLKTGLDIRIDNPSQLGSDIVADAVGALGKYPKPIILFDLGTATTIGTIDGKGHYLGGVIFPGVRLGLDALASRTAQLPQIGLEAPRNVIGPNTEEAMKSGAVFGTASFLDGMVARIEEQLGEKATVVATGGIAHEIVAHCRCHVKYDENLLLEGLRAIYLRNCIKNV
ncbi:MAG: type III pantothenate kinase [Ethanoligenens sp.]